MYIFNFYKNVIIIHMLFTTQFCHCSYHEQIFTSIHVLGLHDMAITHFNQSQLFRHLHSIILQCSDKHAHTYVFATHDHFLRALIILPGQPLCLSI